MTPVWRSRTPSGAIGGAPPIRDPDVLASFLEDAAHVPGGFASELFAPASEADVAAVLRASRTVLPIGAQSSLTGGATPMGETLVSTKRLNRIEHIGSDLVRVQAGVTLAALDAALARENRFYPPAPTYAGACVGGTVSTNAAGAATFKYGATRSWVQAITVVLAGGDVLDIARGDANAGVDGHLELDLAAGRVRVPVPTYRMPATTKLSAGYFARPGMDLVDLFVGAEGTLGIVTAATLRILPVRPALCMALVMCPSRAVAWALVHRLRNASMATWRAEDPNGIDISGIEHMDARCLALLREDGVDRTTGVAVPADSEMAALITLELAPPMTADRAYDEIGRAMTAHPPDTALVRFCALLAEYNLLDRAEFAVPGDARRSAQLLEFRESVPLAVNRRVGQAQRSVDARIEKTAADIVVPFDRLPELMDFCDAEARRRRLDVAVWGHIGDGNLHPNVIPRAFADVENGRDAVLAMGRDAIRLGGAPLAEHGVGRNRTKQRLLVELYGAAAIDEMRRVKTALDPDWKLSPGVIFAR